MSTEDGGEDQEMLRNGWGSKAGDHVVGCGCRSRQHRLMWGAWSTAAAVLALLGVGGAALASASLFAAAGEGTTAAEVGAWLGAVAAVAAGLNAWVAPQVKTHKAARDGFAQLVSRFDDFSKITVKGEGFARVRADWEALTTRRDELQDGSPEPPVWAKWWTGKRDSRCKE